MACAGWARRRLPSVGPTGAGTGMRTVSSSRSCGVTTLMGRRPSRGRYGTTAPAGRRHPAAQLLREQPPSDEPDSAATLARACTHLPLALRIAAKRVASHPLTPLADLVA